MTSYMILHRRRQWHPTPVLLPGKSHGRRSLVGCSPWGREELDTTERLPFHFSLSCIGEGNGNPLWSSCLENPRDGGAWWASVNGVAQSRTKLNRLSSSSIVIHTVKGYGIVNKAEIDVSLKLFCFLDDPTDVGNLISGSSAFSKFSLNIWNFVVHILLKPGLENFEHYFISI